MSPSLLLLMVTAARSAPTAEALRSTWQAHADAVQRHAKVAPSIDGADFAAAAAGRIRVRQVGDANVQGLTWTDVPKERLWVAVQDPEHRPVADTKMTLTRLPGDTPSLRKNYQHLPLPWPVSDRQWVAEVAANAALAKATGDAVWERSLRLLDPGLAPAPDPDAVWLEASDGGWVMVDAGGGTLLAFVIKTDMGGNLPVELTTVFAQRTVTGTIEKLIGYGRDLHTHYTGTHLRLLRPDGSAVQPEDL